MAKRKPTGPWPYGLPTKECDVCHGSGMARGAADRAMASRSTFAAPVKCSYCSGRGRTIDDAGSRICKHKLQVKDCAICKEWNHG